MMMTSRCRALLVYPRFNSESFWGYKVSCEVVGARHPAAPLGLITVAAMLPQAWEFRLVDRNIKELSEDELRWADLVLTGGMLFQRNDSLKTIERAHAHGKPTIVGGPDVTSHPEAYAASDFRMLGEAESVIDEFVKQWNAGHRSGILESPKFQADVTKTPIPRFDLLNFENYLHIGVQFSRGCPFTCEFCDIIELYGRVPRTKTTAQMLAELDRLYELGYRGHVDFVDDNLIGNKKAVKAFLPHLKTWLEQHDYPFEFSTEASLNLSDDEELLVRMRDANFFAIFIGIESPDEETLRQARKKQNIRRSISESVHRIYAHGIFVTAGFIVGFDSEKGSVARPMVDLIEDAAIPINMIGLLFGLSNTQLARRLKKEGRLHDGYDQQQTDHCTSGLNFDTLRPRNDILRDYRSVLEQVYNPAAFAGRLKRLSDLLDRSKSMRNAPKGDKRMQASTIELTHRILSQMPADARRLLWDVFTHCAKTNPAGLRLIVLLMGLYLHVGPFSRRVMADIDRQVSGGEFANPNSPLPARLEAAAATH
jgi:Domain of unknown function (DUF4070)/Radical SAM superfamily